MQINLTGHHITVTPALKDYVSTKLKRLERHFDHVTNTHVILTVEKKTRKKAETTVHVSGGNLHAEALDGDMYAAIDALVDKLDRQIKRHKEKLTNHHEKEGGLKVREAD